jgi:hypothetical protein
LKPPQSASDDADLQAGGIPSDDVNGDAERTKAAQR